MGAVEHRRTTETMGVIVSNIAGRLDTGVVIAGVRCGAKGLLNLEAATAADAAAALARVQKFAGGSFGVKLDAASELTDRILDTLPASVEWIVVSGAAEKAARLKSLVTAARRTAKQVLLEVTSAKQASAAVKAEFDAIISRGDADSAFALLPAVIAESKIPVWVAGGVGLHTVAGFWLAGAEGVVLDNQLLLTPQCDLPARAKEALQRGETGEFGADAALAAPLAQHFANVAGIVNAIRVEAHRHMEAAVKMEALAPVAADGFTKTDPASLKTAIQNGARGFLVEGGLLAWESMITALYLALERGAPAAEMTAVFGGGISDATGAAMVAAMASPLAARGMKVGLKIEDGGNAEEILAAASGLLKNGGAPAAPSATKWEQKPCDIAIVGMSCLLPKAPDIQTLWRNLLNTVDAIDEIPAHRFDYNLYFDADKKTRDKIYSKWGGFLDPVPFDPMRYGIPPASLNSIDPMQLLALVGVENALRDAGYDRREFNRERTSVILGISGGLGEMGVDYAFRSNLPLYVDGAPEDVLKQVPEWTEDSFAGLLPNVAAGRVANRFNFGGTNFIVDAACASSLTAVYVAVRELNSGACDTAIVGGVDATQNAFGFLCFSKAQALSPRGRCRPFDANADGIAIAEGTTMLVLKRLVDAERDGDRIYAVIKGIAGSSDGRGRSMTAPRLEGQVTALRRAYAQAGVDSSTIGLIEAHGTGTTLGDTTEIAALDTVFRTDNAAPLTCAVGSIKSMVGHTKSAAGATSLMKVALALHHKVLPPTLHVETQNPKLREEGTPFFVCSEPQPFLPAAPGLPRRAGISAFGFGGTNFHALVEEYRGDYSDPRNHALTEEWPAELFLWTAETPDALAKSLALLEAALQRKTPPALRDLALSVSALADVNGEKGPRLAIVASTHQELRDRVAAARQALAEGKQKVSDNKGLYLAPAGPRGKLAFLFPGQGSQYPNMLHDLALHFAEFRQSLERADEALAGKYDRRISSLIYPPTAFTDGDKAAQMQAITDTVVAQPALGVVEIALAKLMSRLGVKADMTAGHSYGEYVALAAAGVFDEDSLFRLSEARGRAIKDSVGADSGTMAAVSAEAGVVEEALAGIDVVIANYNSPKQTIIAGATKAVEQALERLKEKKLAARGIPVACAFHSPLMHGAASVLGAHLAAQKFEQPSAAVYSNTLAAPYPAETAEIGALLTKHLISPVRFTDQIRVMYEDGARIFLEVGPKGVLSGLSRQILDGKDCVIIQTETSAEKPGIPQWLNALAQLAVNGIALQVDELFRGRGAQPLDLAHLPAEVAKAGWAMTPSRVFPVGRQPQIRSTPVKLVKPSDVPPPQVVEKIVEKVVEKVVEKPVPAPVAGVPTAAAPAAAGAMDAVLLQFQTLMGQFLQTQSAIMSSYLQGGTPAAAPLPAVPVMPAAMPLPAVAAAPMPIQAPPAVMAPPPGMMAAPPPPPPVVSAPPPPPPPPPAPLAAPVTAPVAAKRDVSNELLKIASERTGYPADMLDLNAGIEADLGIDSIKRVEILSAFQRLCPTDQQAALQGVMEKLTSARTLKEIIERLTAVVGSAPAPAAAPVPVAVAAAPAAPGFDAAGELLKIASERTGYPADMLDLNAGIEADLGIDSIKRVEILSAFQKLCSTDQQAAIQGVMEKLTSARTLKEIIERLTAVVGSAPAPAAPAPAVVAVAPAAPGFDVAGELLKIAAERTGYPADMLDLNAGIEADLGIDSIKRVEILSAFQKLCSADQQAAIQGVMEKLTSARTLKEIIERLTAIVGSAPPPAPAAPAPAVVAVAPAAPGFDAAGELLKIAAERTGYPADMLDLNAGIEADLGIDSIKRVEILSAFQKLCSADQQAAIQGVMEKLTSARTLKEIIERLTAVVGSAPPPAPAAPAPVAPAPAGFDVAGELLGIASERTGYPADMLDLNAGIEADLGIDSIKRVEILSAFQKRCSPDQQVGIQGVMDKLTSARTLKEVIERIAEAVQPATPALAEPELPAVPRFRMAPVDRPLAKSTPRYVPGRVCLITDDETGIAAGIAEEHQRGGEKTILLRHSAGSGVITAEGVISADLTDTATLDRIVEQVRAQHGAIGAIIHALPLRAGHNTIEDTLAAWRDHVRQDVRSLYALARASETDLKTSNHGLVAVITARGGAFGYEPSVALQPTHHGVADFVKTLALEFNGVQCKVIDIDPTDPLPILRRKIADEIASGDDTLQVGLPGDRRLTILPEHAPVNGDKALPVTRDWVILLTGGARGITAGVAQKLAERYQPTLILAGASPLPPDEPAEYAAITDRAALKTAVMQRMKAAGGPVRPAEVEAVVQRLMKDREIRHSIQRLRDAGSRVAYHSLDVRDEAAMKSLLEGIYAEHGRLDAVIHGAGIIEDKLLKDKTPESFDRVVHTKTDSSWLLSRLLKPESLQCLIFMSSITAAFGNRAQADYAIANGVMNGYALKLAAEWPGRVVAMNWGPWDQHGMVTDEVRRQFLSRGIHMIPVDAGVESVLREIERGAASDAVVAFGAGPWGDIAVPDGTARTQSRSLGAAV